MNKKNKLSAKGLEKIFGNGVNDLITEIEKSNDDLKKQFKTLLPIDKIIPNPYQPRKTFDKNKLEELALSIKELGVIQPIIVKESLLDNYYLIAGERRLKASKLAGKTEIPAIILEIDDEKMHQIALIENIQRVDLNPLEEAISMESLMKHFNITQEKLSKKISKSKSYVSNSIRLLGLPESVKSKIMENKLTMGHVKPLLAISNNKELVEKISNSIVQDKWNVRKVEAYISSVNNHNKNKNIKESNDIYNFLANKLTEKLSTRVKISSNKINISYNNINDLNRILEILNLTEK